MSGHTPGPWHQGRTLLTPQTQRWSEAQWDANESHERRIIFSEFTQTDQGRGRRIVATCHENKADARLIASAPDLLEALRPFAALLGEHHERERDDQPIFGINDARFTVGDMRRAVAAIAKATGGAT